MAALMRSDAAERGDAETALRHLTEVASQILRVERSSFWRFQSGDEELACFDLYERFTDRHMSGATLHREEKPAYFEALRTERSIAAHDAVKDPRTAEFAETYLLPLGITSMLDAPVVLQGTLIGVVCHEHVGPPRAWQPWEELAAESFADFVAMVLGAAERRIQAYELDLSRRELEDRVEERTRRLRDSEASVRRLFAAAPVAMVLTKRTEGSILAANRRASALFGLGMDDTQTSDALDLFCDLSERARLLDLVSRTGSVERFEARLRRADGAPFWADVAAQALVFDGGEVILLGVHDISEQKGIEEKLRLLATTDSLTGALTRRRFFEVAEDERARAARYARPLSIAMIDADYFKRINDEFGHIAGDEALRHLVEVIRAELRKVDAVARCGGEEFMVLLPETTLDAAELTMERVRRAVAESPAEYEGRSISIQISVGVVELHLEETLVALLKRVDDALYTAKGAGRNRVVALP